MFKYGLLLSVLLVAGCSSYGVIENKPKTTVDYRLTLTSDDTERLASATAPQEVAVLLAFSGGGHRAAALSYGVLEALRDIPVASPAGPQRLLDHVDTISAVSGGALTAAYYGLVGDDIFVDYKQRFLSWNMQEALLTRVKHPSHLLGDKGRSEIMIDMLNEVLFKHATIEDINRKNGPNVILNASDLGRGVRLSFLPNYFDLLCSDVRTFSVARAVTASAAVPLVFNPIVLENYDDCGSGSPEWLMQARRRLANSQEMSLVIEGLASYGHKQQRRYIHLVDGGITDNLGLRAVYENVQLSGGVQSLIKNTGKAVPKHLVVIAVDASTKVDITMDQSPQEPSIEETVNGIADAQLHRYNAATLALFEQALKGWSAELSTPDKPVKSYFINVSLQRTQNDALRRYYNTIPTGLSLTPEQLEHLIAAGKALLLEQPAFVSLQRALSEGR